MPTLNFNVKIKAGARTPVEVSAHSTAINEKTIAFINGRTLTSTQIAEWLQVVGYPACEGCEHLCFPGPVTCIYPGDGCEYPDARKEEAAGRIDR